MNYFEVAAEAIEMMVAELHENYSNNWADIVPISDEKGWGLTKARWSTEGRIIVDSFENSIGSLIGVPNRAIDVAGEKPLDEFQSYLAAKAENVEAEAIYDRTKSFLERWRK